jgi:hypothetical protein
VTEHMPVFLIALVLFFCLLLALAAVYLPRARRQVRPQGIDDLLARLVTVDRHKLSQVAADVVAGGAVSTGPELESWQVWELVGGLAGVEALARNCEVLIDLACYVQQWYPEALPVAEQLRLNAREIQWHLDRLRGAEERGHLEATYPEYAQRAVALYCSMTQHVLSLYEATGTAGLQQLQAAL